MSLFNPGDWAVGAIDKQIDRMHAHAKDKHYQALLMQKAHQPKQLKNKPTTLKPRQPKKSDFAMKHNTTLPEEPQMDVKRTTQIDPSKNVPVAKTKVPVKNPKTVTPVGTKPKKK